jgi:hypothetical protein
MSFRRHVAAVDDPIISEYVESLLYRLVASTEVKDRRLEKALQHLEYALPYTKNQVAIEKIEGRKVFVHNVKHALQEMK